MFLNQVWKFTSLLLMSALKLNQLKCTTNLSPKLFPETMSDSTLNLVLIKSKEDTSVVTKRTTHQEKLKTSLLKLSLWTTQVKLKVAIVQFWIATLHILPANSKQSNKRLTEEQVKLLKKSQNSSKTETQPLLSWNQANQCAVNHSPNILLSVDLPLEIWNKQLLLVSLKPSLKNNQPQPKRNDYLNNCIYLS